MAGSSTTTIEPETVTRAKDEILQTRRELAVSPQTGLLTPKDLSQALELGQAMAKGEFAVPKHLRGSPGACLAIIELASNWGLMAFGVANQSYVVSDRLCFMAQLVHSVIKKRVPLKNPSVGLQSRYEGEGQTRKVTVFAEVVLEDGTTAVLEWESPLLKDIQPQNSPLWKTDVDLQLFYRTTSRWQRRYFPEIMLGVYTKDDIEDMTEEERATMAKDITPSKGTGLAARLSGTVGGEGYHPDNMHNVGGRIGAADELANVAPDAGAARPSEVDEKIADAISMSRMTPATEPAAQTKEPEQKAAEPAKNDAKPAGEPDANPTEPKAAAKKERAKPAAKPTGPQSTGEYIGHLRTWLANHDVDTEILAQWGDEKKLRTICGVMGEDLDTCVRMKNERLAEVRGK